MRANIKFAVIGEVVAEKCLSAILTRFTMEKSIFHRVLDVSDKNQEHPQWMDCWGASFESSFNIFRVSKNDFCDLGGFWVVAFF